MTVVAILFGVACWMLGSWQWSRHVEQRTKVLAIEQNYEAAPVPIATALTYVTVELSVSGAPAAPAFAPTSP